MPQPNTPERIWARVDKSGTCWLWTGLLDGDGYGRCIAKRYSTSEKAHRVIYAMLNGPIPKGLEIDHLCRVRACVNPAHLEAVTPLVNIRRSGAISAVNAAKTHCVNGHEFTPENTYRIEHGWRVCRACQRDNQRRCKARKRAAA